MSSSLQSDLELLFFNNYGSLAIITVVVYDYILTFSQEVDYVWRRPWTWVSTMFLFVRYVGICAVMIASLVGSTFFPGPLEVSKVIYVLSFWAFLIFLFFTDLLMIMRVYAMWNRSRKIIWIPLFFYVTQIITNIVCSVIYENPNTYLSITIIQVLDYSFCNNAFVNVPAPLVEPFIIVPRLALAATLVILVVAQTVKQSVQMYRATKRWELNRYMQLLARDGIIYFVVNLLYHIYAILTGDNAVPNTFATDVLLTLGLATFYPLVPRFIISVRELFDHDARGHFHVDSGFGRQGQSNAGLDTTVSTMAFMGEQQDPEMEPESANSGHIEMSRRSGLNEDVSP